MDCDDTRQYEQVCVQLGERSYDILIGDGLIEQSGKLITQKLGNPDSPIRTLVVSDQNVAPLYLGNVLQSFKTSGIEASSLALKPGEKTKDFANLQIVVDAILEARLERHDAVVALGGGVIGDLTGFAAGIARRGMKLIQMPTSLLAQVDSSVGGKTGINSGHGKNLVGVFHQPDLVIADTQTLNSLSKREFAAGYAEIAKYGLINDVEFFAWLEENWTGIFEGTHARAKAIAHSCRAKAKIVAQDERESGVRALLNLGHTFGHALEGYCQYDSSRIVHGEAVSIGMVLAHKFSNRMNLASQDDVKRVKQHLANVGLPINIRDIPGPAPDSQQLLNFIFQDKKVSRGSLTFILTKGLGQSFISKNVPQSEVQAFLQDELKI